MQHPGELLKELLRDKGLTQKDLASILGKSKSTVNEIIKWKRNFTIWWDYDLHKWIDTEIWFWINKQMEFDYGSFLSSRWDNTELKIGKKFSTKQDNYEENIEAADKKEILINKKNENKERIGTDQKNDWNNKLIKNKTNEKLEIFENF